jgi:pyruvate kinase
MPCRLCLVWGIHAVRIREADRVSEIVEHACETVRDEGLAGPGDIIAIAAGMPFVSPAPQTCSGSSA